MTTIATTQLATRSLQIIRDGQAVSGAYVASPTYPTYGYAWLRDGSFCAYAMDCASEPDSATAFHRWVADTINSHRFRVEQAIAAVSDGADRSVMLPTRFTLDGEEEQPAEESWPNFQLDGYGTWIWALYDHSRRHGPLDDDTSAAVALVARYLDATSHLACYDCWEEFGDQRHTSTVGAVAAGLRAAGELLDEPSFTTKSRDLVDELRAHHMRKGRFVKFRGDDRVDASLLWLAHPFAVVEPDDPIMTATVGRIRRDLHRPGGGVKRYLGDSFYGGGEWILLTAWLGWHDAAIGRHDSAHKILRWIEDQANADGELPEQVHTDLQTPDRLGHWIDRWGPVATPLLWSHAMYLVLLDALDLLD